MLLLSATNAMEEKDKSELHFRTSLLSIHVNMNILIKILIELLRKQKTPHTY